MDTITGTVTAFGRSGNARSISIDGTTIAATLYVNAYDGIEVGDKVMVTTSYSRYPLPNMTSVVKTEG